MNEATVRARAWARENKPKCAATTPCIVRGCNRKIHCVTRKGHKTGHRFQSHAEQHR